MLSARNQLKGTIKSIKLGNILGEKSSCRLAKMKLSLHHRPVLRFFKRMNLKEGDPITVIIKATEVMLSKASNS